MSVCIQSKIFLRTLGAFVADHRELIVVLEHAHERGDRRRVGDLTEHVADLVAEERRSVLEALVEGEDGLDVAGARLVAERKDGAVAVKERKRAVHHLDNKLVNRL